MGGQGATGMERTVSFPAMRETARDHFLSMFQKNGAGPWIRPLKLSR